jgi:hypothetical protein
VASFLMKEIKLWDREEQGILLTIQEMSIVKQEHYHRLIDS